MGPVWVVIKEQTSRTYSIEGGPGFNIIRLIGCMCHVAKERSRSNYRGGQLWRVHMFYV